MGRKFSVVEGASRGKGKSGYMGVGSGGMENMWNQEDGGLGGGSNGEGMSIEEGYMI